MKHIIVIFFMATAAILFGGRTINISEDKDVISEIELVIDGQEPLVKEWLAPTMQDYLEKITGRMPQIAASPTGCFSIILGAGKIAKENGIDVARLPEEGYYIVRKGNLLFLCGKDDPAKLPRGNFWKMWFCRNSISAMYDFLERFADCVFAAPFNDACAIPRKGNLVLPKTIDILEIPDFPLRSIGKSNQSLPNSKSLDTKDKLGVTARSRMWLEARTSMHEIPFGHGQKYLELIERFAKTKPEYFALMEDGRRHNVPDIVHPGQICYSNAELREVIYQDIKAYLTGQKPFIRGLKRWDVNAFSRKYVSVMPQDWFYYCCCPECAKLARGARYYQDGKPEDERMKTADALNEMLWKFSADFARRLANEGIEGCITQMAYSPLREPPRCELPENMEVMVAVPGQAHHNDWEKEVDLLKRWNEKLGRKVFIWTYPGKHMGKVAMAGIPNAMHRHNGKYFKLVKDYIHGAFIEEETDVSLFTHLNDYVFSHVAWNNATDVDKLLEKYYCGMYGSGAPMMQKYFDTVEDLWCNSILMNVQNTALGPVSVLPTIDEVWTDIYSEKQMQEFEHMFDEAEKASINDAECIGRIRFMREYFHGPIVAARKDYIRKKEGFQQWKACLGEKVFLRPCKGMFADVLTSAVLTDNGNCILLDVFCEEPDMQNMAAKCGPEDRDGNCWMDSDFEFFINPSGDRKTYFQFAFNSRGSLLDAKYVGLDAYLKWDSQALIQTQKQADGWTAQIRIPKAPLGGVDFSKPVPVNFCRHRVAGQTVQDYQWSPSEGQAFKELSRFGTISNRKDDNLLKNGNFTEILPNGHYASWSPWKSKTDDIWKDTQLDHNVFITGGASLKIKNEANVRAAVGQKFKAKANTKYVLSYYIRIKGLDMTHVQNPTGAGCGAYIYAAGKEYCLPNIRFIRDTEWLRQEFEFTTGSKDVVDGMVECTLGLWNWNCEATVWFDNVKLNP